MSRRLPPLKKSGKNTHIMKWINTDPQARLYLIAAIVLLAGLSAAVLIYLKAETPADSVLIHEFENSKMYRHDLELYGGKLNVLADEFRRWFVGLWQGKKLAFTMAYITLALSIGLFIVAHKLPSESKSGRHGENNPGEGG